MNGKSIDKQNNDNQIISISSPGHIPKYKTMQRVKFISPRISPRPYVLDKQMNDKNNNKSPKPGQIPSLNNANSNAMSVTINTSQAVDIQLPCYDEQKEKEEAIEILPQTPVTIYDDKDIDNICIKDDEGSLDSKYISSASNRIKNININNNKANKLRSNNKLQGDNKLQGEGGKYNSISLRDDKLSIGSVCSYNTIPPPPPPPPPSLQNGNHKVHSEIHGINSISNIMDKESEKQEKKNVISPSRHYRVKYSLGIQQDIQNCMSVPGASSNKKFLFDNAEEMQKSQSVSPNALLKPPSSLQRFGHLPSPPIQTNNDSNNNNNNNMENKYQYQQQSGPQLVYLSFPKK